MVTPLVDWQNYWATVVESAQFRGPGAITSLGEDLKPNGRGIDVALTDLEYQRIELIKSYTVPIHNTITQ